MTPAKKKVKTSDIVKAQQLQLKKKHESERSKVSYKHQRPYIDLTGIQVCSNEGPRPFPSGDNYKMAIIQ